MRGVRAEPTPDADIDDASTLASSFTIAALGHLPPAS